AERLRGGVPQTDGARQGRFDCRLVGLVEHVAIPLVVPPVGVIAIEDGVCQAADAAHDGNGAVFEGDHLGQATGLKQAGNDEHVGSGVDQVGEFFVVSQFEV